MPAMLDTSPAFAPAPSLPVAETQLDVATRRLRKAIVSCELAPGAFVHEAALVERFALGRAGIRVALTELSVAGFVERRARQGWQIAPIDGALAAAVLDGRRRLEPSLATLQPSGQTQAALVALLGVMDSVSGRTEPVALSTARSAERQLRNLLAAATGPLARRWLGDIWDHADRIVRMLDLAGHPIAPAELGDLVSALAAGDAEAASLAIAAEHRRFTEALAQGLMLTASRPAPPLARSARRTRRTATITTEQPRPLSKEQQR